MASSFTEQMTQSISVAAASVPPSNNSFSDTVPVIVGPIDMMKFRRVMGHIIVGVVGSGGTVKGYFQSSATSGGSFVNVTGGAVTGILNAANTEATIEMRSDQLTAGTRWVQLAVLNGTANCFIAASIYGSCSNYSPAQQYDYNTNAAGLVLNRVVM